MTTTPPDAPPRFHMPAEWEPHEATWIAWPHERDDWPGKFGPIPWVYVEIVRHLAQSERVRVLVEDSSAEAVVRSMLKRADVNRRRVEFFSFPTDRVWTRDYGPMFAKDAEGQLAVIDW